MVRTLNILVRESPTLKVAAELHKRVSKEGNE